MTIKPNKPETVRINMNLPEELVQRIDEYGRKLCVNRTTAMTFLINNALTTDKTLGDVTELIRFVNNNQALLAKGDD